MMSQHLSSVLTKILLINASIRIMLFIVIKVKDHHLEEVMIFTFLLVAIKTILHILTLVILTNHLIIMDQMNQSLTLLVPTISQFLIIVCFN